MSAVSEAATCELSVRYQPRLLRNPEDSADSSWDLAVLEVEPDDVFNTPEEAHEAGIQYIRDISASPRETQKNLGKFRIVRLSCGYVPFPAISTTTADRTTTAEEKKMLLSNIDWSLLVDQKAELDKLIYAGFLKETTTEVLIGLVNLLDALQDYAEREGLTAWEE